MVMNVGGLSLSSESCVFGELDKDYIAITTGGGYEAVVEIKVLIKALEAMAARSKEDEL